MSRIGRAPIKLPQGVEINVTETLITVKGPLGTLTQDYDGSVIEIKVENGEAVVSRKNEENPTKAKHGLYRALLNNMVIGVTNGFTKTLIVNGVGWKVSQSGKDVVLSVGLSHTTAFFLKHTNASPNTTTAFSHIIAYPTWEIFLKSGVHFHNFFFVSNLSFAF